MLHGVFTQWAGYSQVDPTDWLVSRTAVWASNTGHADANVRPYHVARGVSHVAGNLCRNRTMINHGLLGHAKQLFLGLVGVGDDRRVEDGR